MRHVPTSIYIDTEFFHRQGFRFDTSVFIDFRNTFAKGGLRLLVPVIMERELFRHFQKEAEKAAEGVIKAHKTHPINSLSLIDLPGKNELKSRCIAEMTRQWLSFKEHFVVENLPIVGCLEDVVDWYFDIKPPFADKNGKQKEFPDAFIISVLDQYHHKSYANIAVIGRDEDFIQACASRRYISHFIDFKDYIDEFRPELSGKDRLPEDIDLTKPITTEDLTELKAILSHGGTVTSLEIQRVMQLLERRGANYDYFFQHANDQIWLSHLSDHGYFLNPPNVELRSDGHYNFPWWPPLEYLNLAYDAAPDAVLSVIAKIPSTNNFRVLEGIAKIVLKNDSVEVFLKFSKILLLFIENCAWGADRLILDLLSKKFLFHESLNETTPVLLLKIVEFRPDKEEEKKRSRRKESSDPWETLLYPIPRFDQWEYQQILEHGFRPLADKEPYQVARILIDATSSMIRMSTHQDVIDKGSNEDFSEIWCRRLDKPDRDYRDSKEILLQTLTYTCKKVFEKVPQSIDVLDQTLRNQRWKIFSRLRQHLYALYPNEQTLLWIRDFILDHEDYSKYDHHYEFQLMIRRACEHFGQRFLSETERKTIFDAILSGPSKDEFQEWMGDRYNEEAYLQRQRYFHRKQLRPFAALLNGAYLSYYDELEKGKQTETISDESYSPIAETSVGWVSSQSPKSVDALGKLTDDELLTYLNDWDEEHRDSNNRFVEINISSLASVFQLLFKDKIVSDGERLAFWKQHRDNIERPIYIAAMCKAMQELVKDKHFDQLDQWIDFCDWILSHSEQDRKNDQPEPTEESREHPDWGTARRAVVDILDACLSMEVNAPISHREGFIVLLQMLCTQFDWRLDRDRPVLLNRDDQITEAINNTRSRALESLVKYGFWIRRHLPKDPVSEVTAIFSQRINANAEIPLTRPERAILGMHFGDLCKLNQDWAAKHSKMLFPQDNSYFWCDAFGSFLRYNNPYQVTFEILRKNFEFALEHLVEFDATQDFGETLVDRLGQHLIAYYLWEVYPMIGPESLLERFYEQTDACRQHWAKLFDHVGRSLSNSGKLLDTALVERVMSFFDWRIDVKEPSELQEFTYWLKAECLDPEWRLHAFSKILDLKQIKKVGLSIYMDTLTDLLPHHMPLVVACFAKMTDAIDETSQMFIFSDEAKPILKAGLDAEDPQVRDNAERAKENLLRLRRFDFLDIE